MGGRRRCGSGGWLRGQERDGRGVCQAGDDDGEQIDKMTKIETHGEDNRANHVVVCLNEDVMFLRFIVSLDATNIFLNFSAM